MHGTSLNILTYLLCVLNLQTRVYKDKGDNCGPVHITIGDGGNREGPASK